MKTVKQGRLVQLSEEQLSECSDPEPAFVKDMLDSSDNEIIHEMSGEEDEVEECDEIGSEKDWRHNSDSSIDLL